MDGFQKLDISAPSNKPSIFSKIKRYIKLPKGGKSRKIILVIIVLLVLLGIGIGIPAVGVLASAQKTNAQAKLAIDALKKQNITLATEELKKTRVALTDTQNSYKGLLWYKLVPVIGLYISDGEHIINASFHGLDAADTLVASIAPYADVLGLKGQGSFVGGTAQQRIETAVRTMGKVTPRIDDIAKDLTTAKTEIDNVDPNRYFFLGGKKDQIVSLKKLTDDGVSFINDAKPLIRILPSLLGEPKEKKYLVIFQNDKELRPTGGFMTAYAIFRLSQGIIHVDSSSDIYALDGSISGKPPAPRPILEYLPKVPLFNLRDSNLSPDFVTSMETFKQMYSKSSGPDVDGIIAVDTHALIGAMNILGDITADGVTFSTKIDPRCGCPQAIYEMEAIADTPVQADFRYVNVYAVNAARKNIIGDLVYAIMNKAFSSSPKLYWGSLLQEMINQTSQKHVFFYVYDKGAQTGVEALNASGKIMSFEGDYLHVNEANFGGAKSNMFTTEDVSQDYSVNGDGTITKTLTINYKNPFAPSDCNLERGNLCLNAVLRDWIRIYVPKGSKMVNSQGSEVKMITYDELGKTVFEGFLTVRPKGVAKFTISYTLPFKVEKNSSLPLLIQKQGGTPGFDYTVSVSGSKTQKFQLLVDKTLKIDL
ncbi:MAG TPA: DUF4012 domain-containing protein [Patescibacteria group bacterium]|nr:DUF4012 domain-containing protein [Patescibacteria group bacterium]